MTKQIKRKTTSPKRKISKRKSADTSLTFQAKTKFNYKIALVAVVFFISIGLYFLYISRAASVDFKGYYIMVTKNYARNEVKEDTKNPMIAGISARINWKDLEPTPGNYDFSLIDNRILPDANGKPVMLRVIVGKSTTKDGSGVGVTSDSADDDLPYWLFTNHRNRPASQYFTFDKNTSGFDYIPYFWDTTYQQDWTDFVAALGAKYRSNPNLILQITGPWKVHGEPYIPSCSNNDEVNWINAYKQKFNKSQATIQDVSTAYDEFVTGQNYNADYTGFNNFSLFDVFSRNFPTQPFAMAGGLMFCDNISTKPTLDPTKHPQNKLQFETARNRYGGYANGQTNSTQRGFFVQYNGLSANLPGPSDGMTQWVSANFNPVDGTLNKGVLGYQMIGGVTDFGGGGPEISPDQFATSIDNASSLRASYIEIQQPVIAAALRANSQSTTDLKNKANTIYQALDRNFPKLISTKSASPPPPNDIEKPSVSIVAPVNGSTVQGNTVTITANAADNVGVVKVDLNVDGNKISSDSSVPYSYTWDTTSTTNGTHTISAVAYDIASNSATSTVVSVTVNNQSTPPPPPPPPPVPNTPVGLEVIPRNFVTTLGLSIRWQPVENAASYRLYRNGQIVTSPIIKTEAGGQITATDLSVKGFTSYTYATSALNSAGQESGISQSVSGKCDWFIWWFCKS